MLLDETAETRVARAAQWLDEDRPGWRDEISDLPNLDVASASHCVLGQTYGWGVGCGRLISTRGAAGAGLLITAFTCSSQRDRMALNAEWKRVIHAGRVKSPVRRLLARV